MIRAREILQSLSRAASAVVVIGAALLLADNAVAEDAAKDTSKDAVRTTTVAPGVADFYDVIFFADQRPILLRLRIETHQERLSDAWQKNLTDSFAFIDRDKNGVLDAKELGRASVGAQVGENDNFLLKSVGSMLGVGRSAATTGSPADFAERMQRSQPEFAVNIALRQGAQADRLFAALDLNADKLISAEECAGAIERLQVRDLNDDETLSRKELSEQPYPALNFNNFVFSAGQGTVDNDREAQFVTFRTPLDRQELAERWVRKYGRRERLRVAAGSPLALAAKNAKSEGPVLAPLGVMLLDASALAEILKQPPLDAELFYRLGSKAEKTAPRVNFITADGAVQPPDANGLKFSAANGARTITTATERVELSASTDNDSNDLKQAYKRGFKRADMDKNGYVDKKESEQNGDLSNTFNLIDANGDEKLYEEEYLPWLERQFAASASHAVLSASDMGHPFFPSFDTNDDGRLGLRELRTGLAALPARDADGDGKLAEGELVHLYRLKLAPAPLSFSQDYYAVSAFDDEDEGGNPRETKGPEWFRNMDRNQDGDVSRREFLGSPEQFQALDVDRDGLIDSKEAATKKK